ncbi:NADP-dependent oxidoreductase [Leeuwenhoekiella parthenopeia]|uniref:NADP-dependent oxidoreductase n=1 Tax=Leeuwenhoekiella parthenopeia TaxID=2890320 RepID=A0ABS8GTE4_9FLAO|nr:NADP-dependent oxidoreductase [Leeuwenhoekiella parthenopeia]MCC4213275.1 NADP-dependent oxidoreductase [Leeuwenhoekiella parthenopeia]
MNRAIYLQNRPTGRPALSDFKFVEEEKPAPGEGQILLETKYISVDPYLRGRMIDAKSYIPPFELHKPITSGIIAEVKESKHPDFKAGDFVNGMLAWKEFQVSDGKRLTKVDPDQAPLSAYLGILGMTGLTAYFGLTDIGKPKAGETILVTGAAGAVGSVVGQLGKIFECKVVGIAGSDDKIDLITSDFGFDAGINYKTTDDMTAAVAEACPDGVDVFFDNVGGSIFDAVMANTNRGARVVLCGAIADYNKTETPTGPRVNSTLIKNSILMQGFTVGNYQSEFQKGIQKLAGWLKEDKLNYEETIVEGFEHTPQAFLDLFDGKNTGKMVVKI